MDKFLLMLIKAYQIGISPYLGQNCRFIPSCSEYAFKSILKYGTYRGIRLSIKRILKCHPFNPGGYDAVP